MPSTNHDTNERAQRSGEKTMRSVITRAGDPTGSSQLIPSIVAAAALVATVACTDDVPTDPVKTAVPQAPSSTVLPRTCMPGCAKIVYEHNKAIGVGTPEVWIMGTDGSGKKKLADGGRPAWSMDHSKIAYVWFGNNNDIFSMNADGTGQKQLTFFPSEEFDPAYSPDGKYIAFSSDRSGTFDIWVMQSNGAIPIRLTTNDRGDESSPAWSPDGTKIAYTQYFTNSIAYRVQIIDLATKTVTTLPTGMSQTSLPAWSPDGKRIAFNGDVGNGSCGIWIMDAGGSGNKFPFKGAGYGYCTGPAFSPDGKQLAFWNQYNNGSMIDIANIDGTNGYAGLTFGPPFLDALGDWYFK
jgi:Tol biopolymer transport system component